MTPNSTQVNFDPVNPTDWEKSTYYSRDAQGNIIAIYEYTVVDSTQQNNYTLTECNIYGSSRIGNNHEPIEMIAAPPVDTSKYVHYVGHKQYELSNHLGNVMAVISDRKIARDTSANDTVDYYEPDVLLTFDYSPFGAPLHARSFSKEVCHDTTFTMTVEDLNTNFDDGTTQGWQILSTTTQLAVSGGRLRAYKQGKGAGTLGVQQSFMATSGFVYDFTITIENAINPASTVVLEVLDPNNTVIYTQSVSNGSTNTFTTQFTANISGVYVIKVYRIGNNASGSSYIDDVLITHEEEVNELICGNFGNYRWGFNGMEKDDNLKGVGNSYDLGFREYDPRLGRMYSIDPKGSQYSWQSPYTYHRNNPITIVDYMGLGDGDGDKKETNLQKATKVGITTAAVTGDIASSGEWSKTTDAKNTTAYQLFYRWALGTGDDSYTFDENSTMGKQMIKAPEVSKAILNTAIKAYSSGGKTTTDFARILSSEDETNYVESFIKDVSGKNPARALHGSYSGSVQVDEYIKGKDGTVIIKMTVAISDNLTATSGTRYPPSLGGYDPDSPAAVYPEENPYGSDGQFRTIKTVYSMKVQMVFKAPDKIEYQQAERDNTLIGSGTGF